MDYSSMTLTELIALSNANSNYVMREALIKYYESKNDTKTLFEIIGFKVNKDDYATKETRRLKTNLDLTEVINWCDSYNDDRNIYLVYTDEHENWRLEGDVRRLHPSLDKFSLTGKWTVMELLP